MTQQTRKQKERASIHKINKMKLSWDTKEDKKEELLHIQTPSAPKISHTSKEDISKYMVSDLTRSLILIAIVFSIQIGIYVALQSNLTPSWLPVPR